MPKMKHASYSPKNGLNRTHFCFGCLIWLDVALRLIFLFVGFVFLVSFFVWPVIRVLWLKHVFVKCRSNIRNPFVVRWLHPYIYFLCSIICCIKGRCISLYISMPRGITWVFFLSNQTTGKNAQKKKRQEKKKQDEDEENGIFSDVRTI